MYEFISSSHNPKIKLIRELYNPRGRKKHKLFIAEGTKEISKALLQNYYPIYVFINKSFIDKHAEKFFENYKIPEKNVYEIDKELFKKISYREDTEGIIAIFKWKETKLNQIKIKENSIVIILENIEKPGNLGAVLRTADATQVDAVIISKTNFDVYNPNVIRASLGCVFTVNIVIEDNQKILDWLNENNFKKYVATPNASCFYYDVNFENRSAIIFGSEAHGVSDLWLEKADFKIKIPMKGVADSLNLSNSVAVILYELLRQREKNN